jgi:predicted ATP-dependent Lon-type protease
LPEIWEIAVRLFLPFESAEAIPTVPAEIATVVIRTAATFFLDDIDMSPVS